MSKVSCLVTSTGVEGTTLGAVSKVFHLCEISSRRFRLGAVFKGLRRSAEQSFSPADRPLVCAAGMPRATRRVANRSGGSKASRKANRSADSLSDSLTLSTLRARVRAEAAASAGAATASKAVGGSNATSSPKDGSRTGVGEKGPPTCSAREAELLATEESEPSPTLGDISLPKKTGSAGSEDHFVSSVIDSCEEDGWDRLPSIEESSFYARRALDAQARRCD